MPEHDDAIRLANQVLDKPYIDPDGDICLLARQFLRTREYVWLTAEALQELIEDVENKWGDPHTLAYAREVAAKVSASTFSGQADSKQHSAVNGVDNEGLDAALRVWHSAWARALTVDDPVKSVMRNCIRAYLAFHDRGRS